MTKQVNQKVDYGNWVSKRLIYAFGILAAVFFAFTVLFWTLVIPALICLSIAVYFVYARYLFSPKGKNIQNQIWELVVSNLDWNGEKR